MRLVESLQMILEAKNNDRLVIFVGAGVSANSGIPTWGTLIAKIAEKIKYKKEGEGFSASEYLRIPQYFYNKRKNNTEYYSFIKEALKCDDALPNPIDELVLNLLPHHVITTNYDHLLENTQGINKNLYSVVSKDKHLIEKSNNRYLIKMHGDFSDIKDIVLKESDYINYEQNHPLISTFIKALLISHTFLFVGYSLNDNNLNLIMGWIDYFCKQYSIKERPCHFLLLSNGTNRFEEKRLKNNSIYAINLNELEKEKRINITVPKCLTNPDGQKLYKFLLLLDDSSLSEKIYPLYTIIDNKSSVFKEYERVALTDTIRVFGLERAERLGTEIHVYDEETFNRIKEYLDFDNSPCRMVFHKAGITAIRQFNSDKSIELPILEYDGIFKKYLDNQYVEIINEISNLQDVREQLYYQVVLNPTMNDVKKWIGIDASQEREFIGVILQKMRERLSTMTYSDRKKDLSDEISQIFKLMPSKYEDAVYYIKHIHSSMSDIIVNMEKILDDQEKRYEYGNKTWYSNDAFYHIWKLQSYAYEYYFFVKGNYLPIDRFSDIKIYLSYYLRAILCTYGPVDSGVDRSVFELPTHREPFPLSEIEVDMFVKYVNPKDFQKWLKKYSVQKIIISPDVDMVIKVKGLCQYFRNYRYNFTIPFFNNLFLLIIYADIKSEYKIESLSMLIDMFREMIEDHPVEDLLEIIERTYSGTKASENSIINRKLIGILIDTSICKKLRLREANLVNKLMKKTSGYVSTDNQNELVKRIQDKNGRDKTELAYLYRSWLPKELNKEIWSNEKITNINMYFNLIIEGILEYSDDFLRNAIDILDNEVDKRKKQPGFRTFPDQLIKTLDICLLIRLFGFPLDLQALLKYKEYSEHLAFMLSPDDYDYSNVDLNDYMWQNLVHSKEYGKYFKLNKAQFLTDEVKTIFNLGLASKDQQKIVYGVLLDENELFAF